MKYDVLKDQGSRDHMEDFHVVAPIGPDTWARSSHACVALITPDAVVTANIGDSRAILFNRDVLPPAARNRSMHRIPIGTTYQLSRDHKPSDPEEIDRIMQHGGFVTQPHHTDGVHRVMGRLSLSRALGDWDMRPWVSQDADITVHRRNARDEFMVLATDGVWDVMASDEVAASIRRSLSEGKRPVSALQKVLKACRERGSGDNVTIVLLHIR